MIVTLFVFACLSSRAFGAAAFVLPAACPACQPATTTQYAYTMNDPLFFNGNGNKETFFAHSQGDGVKLNIRPHQNGQDAITLGVTGAYGLPTSPTTPAWNYDYSIDLTLLNMSFATAATSGYTFVIGLDTDPLETATYYCYDPINASAHFGFFDHCFGFHNQPDNSCAALPGTTATYDSAIATYPVLQQSWMYSFTGALSNPVIAGRYEMYIAALHNGVEIARAKASLYIGTISGTLPGPDATCLTGTE